MRCSFVITVKTVRRAAAPQRLQLTLYESLVQHLIYDVLRCTLGKRCVQGLHLIETYESVFPLERCIELAEMGGLRRRSELVELGVVMCFSNWGWHCRRPDTSASADTQSAGNDSISALFSQFSIHPVVPLCSTQNTRTDSSSMNKSISARCYTQGIQLVEVCDSVSPLEGRVPRF